MQKRKSRRVPKTVPVKPATGAAAVDETPVGATPGRKRYEQVAEALIEAIRSGRIAVGATLPGELELLETFDVSRHTVREALRRLEGLGLIGRHQGIGTVVKARQPRQGYSQTVRSPAELLRYPAESRLSVLEVQPVKATRKLARLIGCGAGTSWVRVSAVRRIQDTQLPICHVDVYVVPEFAGVARLIGRRVQPVFEMIEQRFGHRVHDVQVEIRAGLIPRGMETVLGVAVGSPSLQVVRRYFGENGKAFEISVSEHPADRYTYSVQLRRGWQAGSAAATADEPSGADTWGA
jgi:DNA-binding GntR family transcriptional regulator